MPANLKLVEPDFRRVGVVPQSLEAEETILGGILLDPNAIARIAEILKPEHFYLKAHAQIYYALLELYKKQQPTDVISLTIQLKNLGQLDSVGGQQKVVGLIESSVSAVNIDYYAQSVIVAARRRELFALGQRIALNAYDLQVDLDSILDSSRREIMELEGGGAECSAIAISDVLVPVHQEIEAKANGTLPPGLACGFYDLDSMTQGFQRSDLIIVAGRPSMGKTSFALNVAKITAKMHGLKTVVFSLEMSKEQLVTRLLAEESRVFSGKLRSGHLAVQDWEPVGHAVSKLSMLPLYVSDRPNPTVTEIKRDLYMLAQSGELGVVIIDYLQLMGSGQETNRVQELSRITRSLKIMARELNVPVIVLSQLSRGVESRTNKRPMMSDLRESGAIEQDADLVMMLYRDEYYNPDTPDRGIAELIIAKHRNGPTGTVKLLFDPNFTQFLNLSS